MYLFFIVVFAAISLKRSLQKIEENTTKLCEYTGELVEKTRKLDFILQKFSN